jgi:hypothetical protein
MSYAAMSSYAREIARLHRLRTNAASKQAQQRSRD